MRTALPVNKNFIIFIILIAAIALRLTHIDADTPSGLSWSAGLYVDEGYKTLSPRNLVLHGNTHWHEADTYPGWMKKSPITQWSVYAAFKNFGVNISSARIVPIIYFSLLVLLYIYLFKNRYSPKLFYLGLVLMATDITLFTFSRVALFEIPISFFIYSLILPITLYYEKKKASTLPIIWLLIGSLLVSYTIKLSGLIYFFPALAAASILLITNNHKINKKQAVNYSAIIFIAILILLTVTYKHWSLRIGFTPEVVLYSIIENPLLSTSGALLIAVTLCAGHIFAYQPKKYFNNLYRLTLLLTVIISLVVLSLFEYSPLRYYVPFIPAYLLFIIEWLRTTSINKETENPNLFFVSISITLFCLTILFGFIVTGLHEYIQMRYLVPISLFITLCIWKFKKTTFAFHSIKKILVGLVIISIVHSIYFIGSFVYNPTYNAKNIRHQLMNIVNDSEIIAGGWAPFLTLGTPIKSLYANTVRNTPETLTITRPDFFMLSETKTALETYDLIKENKNIITGKAIPLGEYNETKVRIYPLSYID